VPLEMCWPPPGVEPTTPCLQGLAWITRLDLLMAHTGRSAGASLSVTRFAARTVDLARQWHVSARDVMPREAHSDADELRP